MSRKEQERASKGSQRWIQTLVNERPELIDSELAQRIGLKPEERVHWLSPLENDDYAEYRDQQFLDRLGVKLEEVSLKTFWPKQGPRWDGLARTDRGDLILVEAKSHIRELVTAPTGAKGTSLTKIRKSLTEVQWFLRAGSSADWATCFYQYTNRLAHLYLLHQLNSQPAYMLFIYFVNDRQMDGPTTEAEWQGAIALMEAFLGLRKRPLLEHVLHAFIDVEDLS